VPVPSAEDLAAKQRFIEAFFDDLQQRVNLTEELFERDLGNEARLLCCCHIEGLGNWLNPDLPAGARTFVKVVADHGGDPELVLILPKRLTDSLPWKSASPAVKAELRATLVMMPQDEAYTESDFIAALPSSTTAEARSFLQREMWRGTVASIAYEHIRSLGAHWLGSSSGVSFSSTTHQGVPVPTVDYPMLKNALDRILSHARAVSLTSQKWFGHT
jgi:hypothetical protein